MYYTIGRKLSNDSVVIDAISHFDRSLRLGEPVGPDFPTPMLFEIDTEISGSKMPSLFLEAGPLFEKSLYEAFIRAGIDNIEVFPAIITNPETGDVFDSYVGVNIVGLVSCADMSSSEYDELADSYVMRRLVINPINTRGLLLFRLFEDPMQILVSDQVVANIETQRFPDLLLTSVIQSR